MLVAKIGETAPDFSLTCVGTPDLEPRAVRLGDYAGQWLMLVFYPRDFTFVCPTELTAFSGRNADFAQRDCRLLGVSADPIDLHREWLTTEAADGGLGPLQFPLASDADGATARAFGVWIEEKKVSTRGLFIIDPDGVLQYAALHNLNVGRSPDEVLRVLDALRTGGLCPASWTLADGTIDPERCLREGTILGHYRIRKKVGGGTFGTVFAAWDLQLERMVAIKVLKRDIFESREALLSESRAAARLNHPHVCVVYAVEEEDGLPLIAMEYVDGPPLSLAIAGGLERDSALQVATQVASGMAAAHAQGVVHGDLKPANIMLTSGREAKILDFGLADANRESHPADEPPLPAAAADEAPIVEDFDATMDYTESATERSSGIQGSLGYMSPEQSLGQPATAASDVFALGLVMTEMFTGRRAHSGHTPARWLACLQSDELATELSQRVDPACRDLVRTMLAREAGQRPAMTDAAQQLAEIAPS